MSLENRMTPMSIQLDFSRIQVSKDRTQHVIDGKPLYSRRFWQVLNYHNPPGYAPVKDSTGAYHIDTSGEPVYDSRFIETFGYYGSIAAVKTRNGWGHIDTSGNALYAPLYEWVGNFQDERCVVRSSNHLYHHIRTNGSPSYDEEYRFAGDYREGIAVVQGNDYLFFHIDKIGNRVHQHSFLDLDVFHKGYARARDERGWFHVDLEGKAIYETRFSAVEPFYNGQARVTLDEGSTCLINEKGQTILNFPRK
jgi:hypothetical protein